MFTPQAHGGHPRYAHELMTALAAHPRSGFRFELVSTRNLHEQFKSDRYAVHTVLPTLREREDFRTPLSWAASRLLYYPRRELAFLKWLKERPDIVAVHFQEWKPWLAAPLFRRIHKMGKKIHYTVHNVVPHRYPRLIPKALFDRWTRNACLMCDGLFVHSEALADKLSECLGKPHPPIRISPHGVWTVPDFAEAPTMEERLSWKKLLFFGSIRQNKGLDLLLDAAKLLPGHSITIAGNPDEMDYFQTRILPRVQRLRDDGIQIDLMDRFIADGEVGRLFATHSAIVLPYTQGFVAQSGVAFMALAYELPMVASEVGGLRDLMNEFKVGETFSDFTPQGLAAAVRSLYAAGSHANLAREVRAAKDKYSWAVAARETIAGYAAAQEGGREADAFSIQTTPAH
jgi:glycosyltransferase involved in cell wall biosynthesis